MKNPKLFAGYRVALLTTTSLTSPQVIADRVAAFAVPSK
jgi:hypothetical protein